MIFFSLNATAVLKKLLPTATLKKISLVLSKELGFEKRVAEVTLAFVSTITMQSLNHDYRGKNKPTNVLSFPHFTPAQLKKSKADILYLGDVLLHLPTIRKEARTQKKPLNHHLNHLIVHGVLHLLGYDHMKQRNAEKMEKLETVLLARLGIGNPYASAQPLQKKK